jgi:Flp pilus assembly protein TadG
MRDMMQELLRRLRPQALVRRLAGDSAGVSAVEFALILPIMLVLLFGGIEVTDALTVQRKVTHVTSTLSDLIAQSKTISASEMDDILEASAAVITPYSDAKLKIKLTGVTIDANGKATVAWSRAKNDTAYTEGAAITLPTTVIEPSSFIVTGEVHYDYTPVVGYVMTGTFDLSDEFYLRPRLGTSIQYTG